MEGTVKNVRGCGMIERVAELQGHSRDCLDRRGTRIADQNVQGLGGDKILREVGVDADEPCCQRRGDEGMRKIRVDELLEFGDELVRAFGWKIETEQFDGDEAILLGLICAKHGAQRARTDLMKYTKRPESVGRRSAGYVRVQRRYSSKEGE